jgi:Zn-finger nucleic acid-binding protein
MGNDGERAAVWAEYRRRRTLTWTLPLVLIVVAFAFSITTHYGGPWLFIAAIITLTVLKALWFQRWPCPRCGKPFTQPKRGLTYSKQCRHCGLGLWKDAGDVDAYREKQRRGEARLAAYAAEATRGKRHPLWRKLVRSKPGGTSKGR